MILTYILMACALVSMAMAVVSLERGLKSADGFKRLEGFAWAAIGLLCAYGLLILSYLSLILSKL